MNKKIPHVLKIKRIYEKPSQSDGYRILVDRLWPRGIKKVDAHVDLWLKEIAPSNELRTWFGHDSEKFSQFKTKYLHELTQKGDLFEAILAKLKEQPVTLLYTARDPTCNNAIILQQALEDYIAG